MTETLGNNSVEGYPVLASTWYFSDADLPLSVVADAGTSAFTAPEGFREGQYIPAGAVLKYTSGGTTVIGASGGVDISAGADNETLIGIAMSPIPQNDKRKLSYIVKGKVWLVAGAAINAGDKLMPSASASYYGAAIAMAFNGTTNATTLLVDIKKCFGKALTTAGAAGDRFLALVDFT